MGSDSHPNVLVPVVALLCACSHPLDPSVSPAAVMLGEWTYTSPSVVPQAPDLSVGLHVQIVIDSVGGRRFSGRVTLWLIGDVGVPPSDFGRVSGTIDDTNVVALVIPSGSPDGRALRVRGELAGDVLTIVDCHAGADTGPFDAHSAFLRLRIQESVVGATAGP